MALSSKAIVDLVTARPGSLTAGRAAFAGRPQAFMELTPAQRAFTEAMGKSIAAAQESYNHPAARASINPLVEKEPLSAADLAWLARLPADPSQVSFSDAATLASMAARTVKGSDSDKRLIAQVWEPVKEIHDTNAAQVALRNASQPLPTVPSSALNALADAVARENDQLQAHEAIARASQMLDAATRTRSATHEQAIADARGRLDAIASSKAERTAVTR